MECFSHIPFRDSKLTRILQPALGGNSQTLIICTMTSDPRFFEETISTLKFASRAMTIQNKPEINEVVSDSALLKRYRKEITQLKKELDEVSLLLLSSLMLSSILTFYYINLLVKK